MLRAASVLGLLLACGPAPARVMPPPAASVPPPPVADPRFPEPTAPEVECAFAHHVVCQPGRRNDRPFQAPPFEGCPRTIPSHEDSAYPQPVASFSALETRRAAAGSCCYIAFFTHTCD